MRVWKNAYMGLSENSVPLHPMVLLIIIPIKWLFHWEYTQHFQTNPAGATEGTIIMLDAFRKAQFLTTHEQ